MGTDVQPDDSDAASEGAAPPCASPSAPLSTPPTTALTTDPEPRIPPQSYSAVFLRFLRIGSLAWGGPVAQIGVLQKELVEEERWISQAQFRRALAVYQVLPGPEATELCVYFGMLARGRIGAILAGLGFILPGLVLMLLLSWVYVRFGIASPVGAAAFVAVQAAVVALVIRAVHRIGAHTLENRALWVVALVAAAAQAAGVHFAVTLAFAGGAYALVHAGRPALAAIWTAVCAGAAWAIVRGSADVPAVGPAVAAAAREPALHELFFAGLRSGLLTFGGAYTVIPFLRRDAVDRGAWMTDAQFLDGLGLSGVLPAPLIIFATFAGYIGGGLAGALLLTAGIFLPAFAFTLVGHGLFERVTRNDRVRSVLDGVTAGVVGLIAATAIDLLRTGVTDAATFVVFALALAALYVWKARWTVAAVVVCAAVSGAIFLRA